jgi:hypothetical protein
MTDPLNTVCSGDRSLALKVRDLLESAGLDVVLEDHDETVRVKVAEKDHAQALALYQGIEPTLPHDAYAAGLPPQRTRPIKTSSDEEEAEDNPDPREKLAERAFRATIFGLVLLPLLPFGLVLWLQALFMPGRLEGWYRRYMYFMGVVFLAPFLLLLFAIRVPGTNTSERMDGLDRPFELVGVWERNEQARRGPALHQLFLGIDGGMRYKISGAEPLDYDGLWGTDKKGLHLYFAASRIEDVSLLGRIMVWKIVETGEQQVVFDNGREQVVFRRR